jgi:hypothetical protein
MPENRSASEKSYAAFDTACPRYFSAIASARGSISDPSSSQFFIF